jgi:hypothetical protein
MFNNYLYNNLCVSLDNQIRFPNRNHPIDVFVSSDKNYQNTIKDIITIEELMENQSTIYRFGVINYIMGPLSDVIKKMNTDYILYKQDGDINSISKYGKGVRCRMIYEIGYIIESFIENPSLQLVLDLISIRCYFKSILHVMPDNLNYLTEHDANVIGYKNINNIVSHHVFYELKNKYHEPYFVLKNENLLCYNKPSISVNKFMTYTSFVVTFNRYKNKIIHSKYDTEISIHTSSKYKINMLSKPLINTERSRKFSFTNTDDFIAFGSLMKMFFSKYVDFIRKYMDNEIVSIYDSDCYVRSKIVPKYTRIYNSFTDEYNPISVFKTVDHKLLQMFDNYGVDTTLLKSTMEDDDSCDDNGDSYDNNNDDSCGGDNDCNDMDAIETNIGDDSSCFNMYKNKLSDNIEQTNSDIECSLKNKGNIIYPDTY